MIETLKGIYVDTSQHVLRENRGGGQRLGQRWEV